MVYSLFNMFNYLLSNQQEVEQRREMERGCIMWSSVKVLVDGLRFRPRNPSSELAGRTLLSVPSHLAVWTPGLSSPTEKPLAVLTPIETQNTWIHENILGSLEFAPNFQNTISIVDPEEYLTFTTKFRPTYEVQKCSALRTCHLW